MKFFICTYTNKVKSYCDEGFFKNLAAIANGNPVMVVDNTHDSGEYAARIKKLIPTACVERIKCPSGPHLFLRNVAESANKCREGFLASGCDHMLIIESDVFPPADLLERLEEDMAFLRKRKQVTLTRQEAMSKPNQWGIIGAIYYPGYHDFNVYGILAVTGERTALSGCTLYNGELIKKVAFRWDVNLTAAFPDAFMSHDSSKLGFTNWNDHDIRCHHAEKGPNDRGHSELLS